MCVWLRLPPLSLDLSLAHGMKQTAFDAHVARLPGRPLLGTRTGLGPG